MATDVKASKRVNHERLVRFVQAAFDKNWVVPKPTRKSARMRCVAADLRGVDTHGVIRFNPQAWYVKWLTEGTMTARPNIRVISESSSTALIDGDRGMGMVIGHRAMELAIAKAKQSGVGMVGVRNSRHFGMSANYAMQALTHDMIGIAMTNASRQVVPTFGREARFGTNPMCFAVPADKELPFVLDMATTTAAAGKLELAARMEKAIPLGWALNEKAEVTMIPESRRRRAGFYPSAARAKAAAIRVTVSQLWLRFSAGCLRVHTALNADQDPRGHFFGAIRIDAFRPAGGIQTRHGSG